MSRVLGLDPGSVRIGVALSDPLGIIAHPLSVIDRRTQDVEQQLREMCDEHGIELIVVGLPVSLSGNEGPAAQDAREFGAWVESTLGREVVYADERFTTVTADRALLEAGTRRERRREVKDKVAAAVMLQSYLDGVQHRP